MAWMHRKHYSVFKTPNNIVIYGWNKHHDLGPCIMPRDTLEDLGLTETDYLRSFNENYDMETNGMKFNNVSGRLPANIKRIKKHIEGTA